MKFEENLRWWVDWLGQLTENDPVETVAALITGQSCNCLIMTTENGTLVYQGAVKIIFERVAAIQFPEVLYGLHGIFFGIAFHI